MKYYQKKRIREQEQEEVKDDLSSIVGNGQGLVPYKGNDFFDFNDQLNVKDYLDNPFAGNGAKTEEQFFRITASYVTELWDVVFMREERTNKEFQTIPPTKRYNYLLPKYPGLKNVVPLTENWRISVIFGEIVFNDGYTEMYAMPPTKSLEPSIRHFNNALTRAVRRYEEENERRLNIVESSRKKFENQFLQEQRSKGHIDIRKKPANLSQMLEEYVLFISDAEFEDFKNKAENIPSFNQPRLTSALTDQSQLAKHETIELIMDESMEWKNGKKEKRISRKGRGQKKAFVAITKYPFQVPNDYSVTMEEDEEGNLSIRLPLNFIQFLIWNAFNQLIFEGKLKAITPKDVLIASGLVTDREKIIPAQEELVINTINYMRPQIYKYELVIETERGRKLVTELQEWRASNIELQANGGDYNLLPEVSYRGGGLLTEINGHYANSAWIPRVIGERGCSVFWYLSKESGKMINIKRNSVTKLKIRLSDNEIKTRAAQTLIIESSYGEKHTLDNLIKKYEITEEVLDEYSEEKKKAIKSQNRKNVMRYKKYLQEMASSLLTDGFLVQWDDSHIKDKQGAYITMKSSGNKGQKAITAKTKKKRT